MERRIIEAADRNEPNASRSHLYEVSGVSYNPMCGYGWNRSDGQAFSILRGWSSARGLCKVCQKNVEENKPAVTGGWKHRTKWI